MSWTDFTVHELKRILVDKDVTYTSSEVKRKANIVALCRRYIADTPSHEILIQYGKPVPPTTSIQPAAGTEGRGPSRRSRRSLEDPNVSLTLDSVAASEAARLDFLRKKRARCSMPPALSEEADISTPLQLKRCVQEGALGEEDEDSKTQIVWRPLRSEVEMGPKKKSARSSVPASFDGPIPSAKKKESGRKTLESFGTSSMPIDPHGHPVVWRIAPRAVEPPPAECPHEEEEENNVTVQEVERGWKTVSPATLRMIGISSFILIVAVLIGWINHLLQPLPFCSSLDGMWTGTSMEDNITACIPCPHHAVCSQGKLTCDPKYRSEYFNGRTVCIRDAQINDQAQRYVVAISRHLSALEGLRECEQWRTGQKTDPQSAALSRAQLESYLRSMDRFTSDTTFQTRLSIVFDEFLVDCKEIDPTFLFGLEGEPITSRSVKNLGGLHGIVRLPSQNLGRENELFWSVQPRKTSLCVLHQTIWAYLPHTVLGVGLSLCFSFALRRNLVERKCRDAIKSIIAEQSRLETFKVGGSCYAVGPSVSDIFTFVQTTDSFASLRWHLTEKKIRSLCSDLSQTDPTIVSSCLSFDMIPFYFSKSVIDHLRRSNAEVVAERNTSLPSLPPPNEYPEKVEELEATKSVASVSFL